MKKSPPTFRRLCLALVMTAVAPWASGQLVQTLKDINEIPVSTSVEPDAMALAGGTLFISTDNALSGSELWKYTVLSSFNGARGVVADAAGNLYVVDTASHVIRKVTTTGAVSVFAGSPGIAGDDDGAGMAAQFNSPSAIAIVNTGPNAFLLFVADTNNHTIRRVTSEGIVTTQAGTAGQQGYVTSNTLQDARFRFPRGIAARLVVPNMEIYVSDSGNHAIRKITIQVNTNATSLGALAGAAASGGAGVPGFSDGTGTTALFNNPGGISLAPTNLTDGTGNSSLYLADTGNHRIRRVGLGGQVVSVAGSATPSATNGTGLVAGFNAPQSVVCDAVATSAATFNVYVADTGNHLIRRVMPNQGGVNGGAVTTLAGSGVAGALNGMGLAASFNAPQGLGLVGTNIIVADTGNHVLRNIVASGAGAGTVTLRAGQVGVAGGLDGAATGTATPVPVQVKDINPGSANSMPQHLTAVGNNLFFTARDADDERDLWKTDGTAAGTQRLGNTEYPSVPDGPQFLTAVGNTVYFQGYSDKGSELWKSDGTVAGTVLFQDIWDGPDSSQLDSLYAVDGTRLLFGGTMGTDGLELRKIGPPDATTSTRVANLFSEGGASNPSNFVQFDGKVYFVATSDLVDDSEPVGRELFQLNLTTLNAPPDLLDMLVDDIAPQGDSEPRDLVVSGPNLAANGGQLFFSASTTNEGRELYVVNANNGLQPTLVVDLFPGGQDSGIDHITPLTRTGLSQPYGVVFTGDSDDGQGLELYFSNGNPIDTGRVTDLSPGLESSILDNFFAISPGVVIFTKEDPLTNKISLYRTDGTSEGTRKIDDFEGEADGKNSATAKEFRAPVLVGSNLYFMLSNDELWRTNGNDDANTVLVHRFRTSTESSDSQGFTRLSDGRVVFSAVTPDEGREPWITDLAGSTMRIHDLQTGPLGSEPQNFTATHDGRFFFSAEASSGDRELYVSNGGVPTLIQDINPVGSSDPQGLLWVQAALPANNKLYFSASGGGSNRELWVLNNTNTLTEVQVDPGLTGSNPDNLTAFKDYVYFSAETNAGVELWRVDSGLEEEMVKDIFAGGGPSNPDELVVMPAPTIRADGTRDYTGRKLYFIATGNGSGATQDQETGRELWVTDGGNTPEGTHVVKDIIPGGQSSIDEGQPAYLTVVGNLVYFVADDGQKGREIWKSNGTAAGTVMVTDLNKVSIGTNLTEGSDPTELRNVNGKLFFIANDGINGRELWVIKSPTEAPTMVRPGGLVAGAADAGIQDLTVVKDVLTFTADDGIVGREIWLTDGTATGTYVLTEFVPGPGSSYPHNLTAVDDKLLFSASDVDIGDEPRMAILDTKLVVTVPPHGVTEELAPGATVDFTPTTPVNVGSPFDLTFRLNNQGTTGIASAVASITGPNAAEFTVVKKPLAPISGGKATDMVIRFAPKQNGERTAMLRITSTDSNNPILDFILTADAKKDPAVATHPLSQIVKVGAPVTMSSTVLPGATAPVTLQWKKNNAPVAGATLNPLYLWAAKLTDGGAYIAEFKSGAKAPNNVDTSQVAQLAVVEDFMPARVLAVKPNAKTILTVNATGNGLTYLWKRSSTPDLNTPVALPAGSTKANTKTLNLPAAAVADSGYYFCEVSSAAGMVIGGTTHVKVYDSTPEFVANPTLPTGIVGSVYFHQLATNTDANKAPTTYSVVAPKTGEPSKLPAGLKLDGKTGIISGIPTTAETQTVRFKVSNGMPNAAAGNVLVVSMTIVAKPDGLNGTFQGLVERNDEINGSAGGRIEIVVTTAGSFSGKLIQGATTDPFKGNLMINTVAGQAAPPYTGMARIIRKGIAAPLDLTFTIDATTKNHLSAGNIASVNIGGAVNTEVYAWKALAQANLGPYRSDPIGTGNTNIYNFGLRLPAEVNSVANPNIGSTDVPQGTGYGTFLIGKTGTLTIAGMTADGEKITCATFVGPNGEVLLYQSLYGTVRKGSVCGLLVIDRGADAAGANLPNDNVINANTQFPFDWTRPPATAVLGTAANTRTYRAGFGLADTPVQTPVELEAFGGYYQPTAHLLQLTSPSATDTANLTFTGANVDLLELLAPTSLDPDLLSLGVNGSKVTVLTASAAKTKFTKSDAKTGLLSGSFDATTTDTSNSKKFTRVVNFLGLIVPEVGNHRGVGYFMLPQMAPFPGASPATTGPILSGAVDFDNNP